MPKTIWKFPLSFAAATELPPGAEPISVQMQGGNPMLWALVEPEIARQSFGEAKRIHVAGTGHDLPDNIGRFIDTFQMEGGSLVFHVFELS